VGYLDAEGTVLHDTQFYPPVAELWYPTDQWQSGEAVLVQTLPWTLNVEQVALVLGLYTGEDGWQNGNRLRITQAQPPLPLFEDNTLIRLGGYQRTETGEWKAIALPTAPPTTPLDATLGDQIVLDGVTLLENTVRPGGNVTFTLHWRAVQPPAFDYSLFAHLLDQQANKVVQLDWQPHDAISRLPATAWIVGQPVLDTQILTLPADLPAGDYQLIVGVYNWQDGQRLAVVGANAEAGDVVTVAMIQVR
jgi:hypothetical protein